MVYKLRQISCELGDPFEVPEQTPVVWYLALRAADIFKTQKGRYPGEEDHQVMYFPGSLELETLAMMDSQSPRNFVFPLGKCARLSLFYSDDNCFRETASVPRR